MLGTAVEFADDSGEAITVFAATVAKHGSDYLNPYYYLVIVSLLAFYQRR